MLRQKQRQKLQRSLPTSRCATHHLGAHIHQPQMAPQLHLTLGAHIHQPQMAPQHHLTLGAHIHQPQMAPHLHLTQGNKICYYLKIISPSLKYFYSVPRISLQQ